MVSGLVFLTAFCSLRAPLLCSRIRHSRYPTFDTHAAVFLLLFMQNALIPAFLLINSPKIAQHTWKLKVPIHIFFTAGCFLSLPTGTIDILPLSESDALKQLIQPSFSWPLKPRNWQFWSQHHSTSSAAKPRLCFISRTKWDGLDLKTAPPSALLLWDRYLISASLPATCNKPVSKKSH